MCDRFSIYAGATRRHTRNRYREMTVNGNFPEECGHQTRCRPRRVGKSAEIGLNIGNLRSYIRIAESGHHRFTGRHVYYTLKQLSRPQVHACGTALLSLDSSPWVWNRLRNCDHPGRRTDGTQHIGRYESRVRRIDIKDRRVRNAFAQLECETAVTIAAPRRIGKNYCNDSVPRRRIVR